MLTTILVPILNLAACFGLNWMLRPIISSRNGVPLMYSELINQYIYHIFIYLYENDLNRATFSCIQKCQQLTTNPHAQLLENSHLSVSSVLIKKCTPINKMISWQIFKSCNENYFLLLSVFCWQTNKLSFVRIRLKVA